MIELEITRRAAGYLAALNHDGYDIYVPKEFSEVPGLVSATGRKVQTPMLSVTRNDFTVGSAFYQFLTKNNRYVGGCAACYYDLGDEPFEAFIRRTSKNQYRRTSDPIHHIAAPVAEEIGGRLIYLGELELSGGERGRMSVLQPFFRILMGLAAIKWWPFDWMYAFVPDRHIKLTDHYGFRWKCEHAITWSEPVPEGRLNDHWLVALNRRQFTHSWTQHS
ncbi:MAG: hypothetical protein QNJ44_16320 [Rhodobacter sp.]|nr:hypothetical protein [Rhodobacter sp.]